MTTRASAVRTLIVDDEPLARRRLKTMLATEPEVEIVGEAGSGAAAVTAVTDLRPDLVLLDIQMPGKDGFAVLDEIAAVHQPVVVFVTAHDEHAIRAFDVAAVDYVLKPVVEERLRASVRRAVARVRDRQREDVAADLARVLERVHAGRGDPRIAVRRDGRVLLVRAAEVQWIEAEADLVRLHTASSSHTLRTTLGEMEARLAGLRFVRIHRSAIVNTVCIREIEPLFKGDYVLVLQNGARVRTGRLYRDQVQALMR